jgi:hypothetical protein
VDGMPSFDVTPADLYAAASTLGAVDGELGCPTLAPGDLGSPELEAALGRLYKGTDDVARAMSEAVNRASVNTASGADSYTRTDRGAMPHGMVR